MNTLRSLGFALILLAGVWTPAIVTADTGPTTGTTSGTTSTSKIEIPNPIKCDTASCLVSQVIRTILGVVAVVATGMFVWGGVLMLTSGGNERRVKQAKDTLVWAAIGIVVIMVSWILIRFVLDSLVGQDNNPSKKAAQAFPTSIARVFNTFVV
jgi:uncharacterized membrane protein YjfL (UPF0719 family)